jgi:hypothetical protein
MANSTDAEESYWNDTVSEPVNIHEGVVSPKGCATDSEGQKEVSETEDGLNDLENSPGILLSLHEPMDVDSDMPETVAESWADSMDDVGTDPSDFQSHTYDRDNITAEQQDNAREDHMPRQYIQGSRDSWRPRRNQFYHDRWSQSRASNWQGSRGRGFGGREPRDDVLEVEVLEIGISEAGSLDVENFEVEEEPIDIHNVLYHEAHQFGIHRQGMIIMA